jgi:DNA-binding transcriptional MerR regulator/methylmalonyl-CoA mutase cobalamin-binding subunit
MTSVQHPIKSVARRTGLSAHVIRIWEKRYGAVKPERTDTNRRLYSQEQIERLTLLRELTQTGQSISHVAKLPTPKLRQLAFELVGSNSHAVRPLARVPPAGSFLEASLAAIQALDSLALEEELKRAATALGAQGLLQRVVAPLAQTIGDSWRDGTLTAAHEHFASAALRVFLGHTTKPFGGTGHAPVLVVATPAGQVHELGALIVGAIAANLGWHVTYLGASLPAAEIAGAAKQNRAQAVALSLVYPEDDPGLAGELTRLREFLPVEVPLLVGGRAMPVYRKLLQKISAVPLENLADLGSALDDLRKPAKRTSR